MNHARHPFIFHCRIRHRTSGFGGSFTASLTVAFIGVLAVLSAARLLSARMKPAPIPVKPRNQRDMRVWNDGKGTIIDL